MAISKKRKRAPDDAPVPVPSLVGNVMAGDAGSSEVSCKPAPQILGSLPAAPLQDYDAYRPMTTENMQNIFQLSPAGYLIGPNHTRSDSTNPPSIYAKHLDVDLRPERIAFFPSLLTQLSEIAANYQLSYKESLGCSPLRMQTTPTVMRSLLAQRTVSNEIGIFEGYQRMAKHILPLVSALLFHTSSTQGLKWSRELRQDVAIPDAALMFDVDTSLHDQLKDVTEFFPHVLLYEFKNLKLGYDQMIAVMEESGNDGFEWEACTVVCRNHTTTGHRTGFDASSPMIDVVAASWKDSKIALSPSTPKPDSNQRQKARHILLQMWSELVRNDATFIVLNAGNYEIIAYRNRANKTLYLSEPFDTRAPPQSGARTIGYVQIHIGLFIASILDALDRASRMKACQNSGSFPMSWTLYRGKHRVSPSETIANREEASIEQTLSKCSVISLLPANKSSGSNSTFLLEQKYHRYPQLYGHDRNSGDNIVGIKIQSQQSDLWHIGLIGDIRTSSNLIIIKTASGRNATYDLRVEYSRYMMLGKRSQDCKIPTAYGYFRAFIGKDAPYDALLLEHVGNPLFRTVGFLSEQQQNSAARSLKLIHDIGYKHGNLTDRTIAMKEGGSCADVYLLGLEKMEQVPEEERNREAQDFQALCHNLKRRRCKGATVFLGPFCDECNSGPPRNVFENITRWINEREDCSSVLGLVNCVGWSIDIPGRLEVVCLENMDGQTFLSVWAERPKTFGSLDCM